MTPWPRRSPISILAIAVLAVTRARTATATMAVGLIPISAREPLAILRATAPPPLRHDIGHVPHRSVRRRRHQAIAQACHRRWNDITATATT
ncbi:hypothetical protein [Streptomyces adelaidensis]|uniref:hypothetical protein n=1 Tax=Streptomyces adelaidensis TaxID=2796465 RepID=UPI001903EFC7|nr:hypothetical protein [Streptomyces adelaidensis]